MKSIASFASAAGLIALLLPALAQPEPTGLLTFFLPDSEPLSLEASAVAVDTAGPDPVTTLDIACPTAASPDNDACRAAGIYPARVYHTQGSVWGGTTTFGADATTAWACTLQGNPPSADASGECTKTILGGGATLIDTVTYRSCYVAAHQRPVVVTAGVDKIRSGHYLDLDASQYVELRSSELSEAGCPATNATIWPFDNPASTRTTTEASSTGEVEATTTPATGTETNEAPAATTSPNGAGRLGIVPMAAWLVGFVAMVGAM